MTCLCLSPNPPEPLLRCVRAVRRRAWSHASASCCARSPDPLIQHIHPYCKFSTPFLSAYVGFLTNEGYVSGAIFSAILLSWVSEKFQYCFCKFLFFFFPSLSSQTKVFFFSRGNQNQSVPLGCHGSFWCAGKLNGKIIELYGLG